eukprot:1156430-Pelagomonas_calceolata.AAC.6
MSTSALTCLQAHLDKLLKQMSARHAREIASASVAAREGPSDTSSSSSSGTSSHAVCLSLLDCKGGDPAGNDSIVYAIRYDATRVQARLMSTPNPIRMGIDVGWGLVETIFGRAENAKEAGPV